jgi:TRAP-type transport system small permease protein
MGPPHDDQAGGQGPPDDAGAAPQDEPREHVEVGPGPTDEARVVARDDRSGALGRVTAAVRAVNRVLHFVAGAVAVGLMFVIVLHVLGRQFFARPFPGTVELTQMAMLVLVYLGLGYAEHEGDHISIDFVYNYLPRVVQLVLSLVTSIFGVLVMAVVAWRLYDFAGVLERGGYTTAILGIPQGPIALIGVVGAVFFILALVTTVLGSVRAMRKG